MATLSQQVKRVVPVRIKQRLHRGPAVASGPRLDTPCFAPFSNLYLNTNGDVRTCCVNDSYPLGNITTERLPEIWGGARQAVLRSKILVHDYSAGCDRCVWQTEGGMRSYAEVYDHVRDLSGPTDDAGVPTFPRRIEFNLSNSCNLACGMCHGELSSTIRLHREKLPPLPRVWGDEFFEDLRAFIPHLAEASFAGGEPFLGSENYRTWALIAELKPDLPVKITTNGTQWSKRVEEVLASLSVWPHVSLDAHTKATFEAIRERSDHDVIMANLDRFQAYAEQEGTEVRIMHCLMPQNHHEFADLLLFAEERNMPVTVTLVTHPPEYALENLDRDELTRILALFESQYDRIGDRLVRNRGAFEDQILRLRNWLAAARDPHRPKDDRVVVPQRILAFTRQGAPSDGETLAREVLGAYGDEAFDNWVLVGPDECIQGCSPSTATFLGLEADEVLGSTTDALFDTLVARFGEPVGDETTVEDEFVDRRLAFAAGDLRILVQPVRDERGWADAARIRFAFRPAA